MGLFKKLGWPKSKGTGDTADVGDVGPGTRPSPDTDEPTNERAEPGGEPVPDSTTPSPPTEVLKSDEVLPDKLTVDGELVDSFLVDMPGDPAQGIPPGQQLVVTQLTPRIMRKGDAGRLVCVVYAEPLADPADREKLRKAMSQNAPHMHYAGTHELIVTSMPVRSPVLLISQPTWRVLSGEAHLWLESKAKDRAHMKLFFPGDAESSIEISIPFNVGTSPIPDWAFPYFNFAWTSRREYYIAGQRNHRRETGRKEIRVI